MLEKTLRVNRLFDAYGDLLTEKQQRVLRLYFRKDWSLSEIAGEEDCSRQAVYDLLQRASERLDTYEKSLGMVRKNGRLRQQLNRLLECLDREEPRSEKALKLAKALREWI